MRSCACRLTVAAPPASCDSSCPLRVLFELNRFDSVSARCMLHEHQPSGSERGRADLVFVSRHRIDARFHIEAPAQRAREVHRLQTGAIDVDLQQAIPGGVESEQAVRDDVVGRGIGHGVEARRRQPCASRGRAIRGARDLKRAGREFDLDRKIRRRGRRESAGSEHQIHHQAEAAEKRRIRSHGSDDLVEVDRLADVFALGQIRPAVLAPAGLDACVVVACLLLDDARRRRRVKKLKAGERVEFLGPNAAKLCRIVCEDRAGPYRVSTDDLSSAATAPMNPRQPSVSISSVTRGMRSIAARARSRYKSSIRFAMATASYESSTEGERSVYLKPLTGVAASNSAFHTVESATPMLASTRFGPASVVAGTDTVPPL